MCAARYTLASRGSGPLTRAAGEESARNHKPGSLLDFDTLLHERTGSYMDTLDQLICQTAQQAIEDGTEAITEEGLNDMVVGRQDCEDDWA
ncbi:hypothetical protein GCM10010326_78010 [Streptomyces xanthochromogenes]|uniref:Uncharacterized protein n=1 Tax=Streptomyces xanthochromogenes TaxID=67384 RepID=A0ABQ3AZ08_9ACTN|nr:hypothetical protein GCM10010326_78010 [Streptomyces xanthochromogenes]